MRRARFGEAAAEIERIEDEEVRTTVVDGVAQPLRVEALLETPTGMRWFVHIPDFASFEKLAAYGASHSGGLRRPIPCAH